MVLLPKGLTALKQMAKEVGLDLRGAYVNLDGGFDSRANRKCIFNAGMIPNIKENPRNRKRPKRGRKRLFNAAIHALRMRVERTFAWEDKFKRLLLRFECIQQRHYGMKLMAYTLITLRAFCGTCTLKPVRSKKNAASFGSRVRLPGACHSCIYPGVRAGAQGKEHATRHWCPAAHSPAVKDRSTYSGAQRPARGGGARCPRAARQPTSTLRPAHACAAWPRYALCI